MITDDDIKKLSQVFATKDDLRSMEDRLEDKIKESEQRLRGEIAASKKSLEKKIEETEQRIYHGIGDILDDHILPSLGNLDQRVTRIERVPVIAHAIKS